MKVIFFKVFSKFFIKNKNFKACFKEYNFHKLYRDLLNFCTLDLSAFYFDIRKDILYCDEIKSPQRQICINLLGLVLDMLLKWFAPILSFTTEEIFQIINQGKNSSIHLETFPNIPSKWKNENLFQKWNKLKIIRNVANAAIETKRSSKEIGSSLEADVQIYLLNKNFEKYFKEYNFHKLHKELLNFCSIDLSAFYFDIRKDILYCDEIKSSKRQICINLLSLILDMLLKWFAPILSFTTEEIFQIINQEKNSSIHLEAFPEIPLKWENEKLFQKWDKLKIIRNVANAAIEIKRSSKEIGSSLEADVEIYLGKEYLKLVKDIDLSEYFITSKANSKPMINDDKLFKLDEVDNVKILVTKAKGKKCSRCWKILENPCQRNNCGLKN